MRRLVGDRRCSKVLYRESSACHLVTRATCLPAPAGTGSLDFGTWTPFVRLRAMPEAVLDYNSARMTTIYLAGSTVPHMAGLRWPSAGSAASFILSPTEVSFQGRSSALTGAFWLSRRTPRSAFGILPPANKLARIA